MFRNRLKGRLSALALGALLLSALAAPAGALAAETPCGQGQVSCSCCICICQCGCSSSGGASSGCPTQQADEGGDAADDTDTDTADGGSDSQAPDDGSDATTGDESNGQDSTPDTTGPTADPLAELRLNELLPNPVGTDTEGEFIEIVHVGPATASTAGWTLRDARGRSFGLPDVTLAPNQPVSFPYSQTKLTLVNSGGTLELVAPDGSVRDTVTYGEGDEGESYARDGANWSWTPTPTPNQANEFPVPADEEPTTDEPTDDEPVADEPVAEEPVEETPTPEEETVSTSVRLSEFLPDPVGDDATGEWIELHNFGLNAADLTGWKLDDIDGGSSPFELDGQSIPAGGYLTLDRPTTKLSLNNDTDSVRLIRPDGSVADSFDYADSKEGRSYARDVEGWFATDEPTPGAANVRPTVVEDEAEEPAEEDETIEETIVLSVEQVHNVADETRVTVRGVVTVPFGVLGQTIFGLRDTDSDYGATVRVYASDRPTLEVGDIVEVDGTVRRRDSGELRLDTFGSQPVRVTGSLDQIDAPTVLLSEIDGSAAGLTVTVTGLVTDSG
ncbi:MAG: lamin tail domain-containing protein, partial [bacterium]